MTEPFIGYEVRPVREFRSSYDGKMVCEVCQPHEADFWSVYGVNADNTRSCIGDYSDEAEAQAVKERLELS